MAAKKKTAAKKPAKRASAPTKAARKPTRAAASRTAKARGGEGEVVYSDVLHELRGSLVSRLIR